MVPGRCYRALTRYTRLMFFGIDSDAYIPTISKIETIKVHHLRPCSSQSPVRTFAAIAASVDLGKSAELGVRSKDKVNHGSRPLQVACAAYPSFQHAFCRRLLPLRAHVEQVDEEVISQSLRPLVKTPYWV